jgi:hypothetical protein
MSLLKQIRERRALTEGLKKVATYHSEDGKHSATVHKDTEWGEHRVKFHTGGKHHAKADYHTEDHEDAHATARAHLKHMENTHKESVEYTDEQLAEMVETLTVEEFEQLDELSKNTLKSYVAKSGADQKARLKKNGHGDAGWSKADNHKQSKRTDSEVTANHKLSKPGEGFRKVKVHATEETQIDEISKNTLASYAIKAPSKIKKHAAASDHHNAVATANDHPDSKMSSTEYNAHHNAANMHAHREVSHKKGLRKAVAKLAKEETSARSLKDIVSEARGRPKKPRTLDGKIAPDAK